LVCNRHLGNDAVRPSLDVQVHGDRLVIQGLRIILATRQ